MEPGKRINITIVDFDMEAHENCSYDMLAVSISHTWGCHRPVFAGTSRFLAPLSRVPYVAILVGM